MNWYWILYIGLGYVLGSIPFALVIGKLFYHTDVRNYGSGNLGGTNAGRVLGKKAGISVIVCDILKVVVAVGIVSLYDQEAKVFGAGFAACLGHCYPLFAHFHGGKAVATMFWFLGIDVPFYLSKMLGMSLFLLFAFSDCIVYWKNGILGKYVCSSCFYLVYYFYAGQHKYGGCYSQLAINHFGYLSASFQHCEDQKRKRE